MKLDEYRVRGRRERLGLTLAMLARKAGTSKNTILSAEHGGDIRPTTARKIAEALDVEIDDLLGGTESPLAEASPSQEKLFDNGVLVGQRRYSEPGLEANKRALETWAEHIRVLVETFGPILDALPESPLLEELLEEYPRVGPFLTVAGPLNKTLWESGLVYEANELYAESKRGGPGSDDLGRRVRAFHAALSDLNELALRGSEWGRRGLRDEATRTVADLEAIEAIEADLRDLDAQLQGVEREWRKLPRDETAPQTTEQLGAESR